MAQVAVANLPSDVIRHIGSFLDDWDVAALRLANKGFAGLLEARVFHLSQPAPPNVFYEQWARPKATRGLSCKKRRRLLCLTAASGSIANLEIAIAAAECLPDSVVFAAAAQAGHLHVCHWLHERRCPWARCLICESALAAAAGAGHLALCRWLIKKGVPHGSVYSALKAAAAGGHSEVLDLLLALPEAENEVINGSENGEDPCEAAARGGHLEVLDWLVSAHPNLLECCGLPSSDDEPKDLLGAVAQGCDLATLKSVVAGGHDGSARAAWLQYVLMPEEMDQAEKVAVVRAAAGSATPDWRAKVEWLVQDCGFPLAADVYMDAACCPDALERMAWLRQQGAPEVGRAELGAAAYAAAARGDLHTLRELRTRRAAINASWDADTAADAGHVHVVEWLVATWPDLGSWPLVHAAVEAGDLGLLDRLPLPTGAVDLGDLASWGNVAAMQQMVKRAGRHRLHGAERALKNAFHNGDVATLRCLRGAWDGIIAFEFLYLDANSADYWHDFHGHVAAWSWGGTTGWRWLLVLGWPVDWGKAEAQVRAVGGPDETAVLALLAEWRQRRREEQEEEGTEV